MSRSERLLLPQTLATESTPQETRAAPGVPRTFPAGNLQDFTKLLPGSNKDLGLLRALAIKQEWLAFVKQHKDRAMLETLDVRCCSAGQTIPDLPDDGKPRSAALFQTENEKFRRIEIRLTKLK